jgi:flotillin
MEAYFNYVLFGSVSAFVLFIFYVLVSLRRVVPTNEVHIVQSSKKTTSYGKDTGHGNTYYEWPAWLPVFGVTKNILPVSNFDVDLLSYEAYDIGRLPFVVDVKAFFRISDSNVAAQRVSSFKEMHDQLKAIVQGAVRTILASSEIEEIMQGRSKFGDMFTKEVNGQLSHWGVTAVKNIELMDIRDAKDSHVIRNIMDKKKSHIEMESRTEVAKNKRIAEIAEIEAKKEVDLQQQSAKQSVGLRTVETQREVQVSEQTAIQAIKEQEKLTKEKEMSVLKVQEVRKAEIDKEVQVVKAQQNRETVVINADGQLEAKRKESEAITLEGEAKANAEKAMQLAPVQAQITLAKEIGSNAEYQKYLITIKQVEASQAIGVEQAKALEKADIKIISNSGNPVSGVSTVRDLFSSSGGTQIGAMLEGVAQTDVGKDLLNKVVSFGKKDQ